MLVDPTQLDDLFTAALAEPNATARAALIDGLCAGNPELRERLEALLVAHDDAGSFLQLPVGESTVPYIVLSERPGTTIGRYKLLEQIGEGGFGVVFMAEQERPVRRRVALKVIKLGMDTKQVVARFEVERQALAMMDHPNIAKVFDAGTTDTGRPYFVMELVRGVYITEYCDQARLPTNDRIQLFQSVCSAMQHAHQKGIIHRDLKPSNVLVTLHDDKAVPKVIDFGVAKATQARLTERTLFTEFRQMIGTPSYMSPEQAQMSGLDIDTRSDIYGLGVLLYELLTGTTPLEANQLANASYEDLRRLICEVNPPSPSARLSTINGEALTTLAHRRQCDPEKLRLNLRSDLDWIVMKCLEKDRQRRYESASALSIDLQHYLNGEPVEARPPTRTYRLNKLIRRNKAGVLIASSIAAALVLGLALASIGFFRARRQAEIARAEAARSEQFAKFMTGMLSAVRPGVAHGRDTALLREILDKSAKRVDSDLAGQPEVQGDMWSTLAGTYLAIGDHGRAAQLYEKAVQCYRGAIGENSAKLAAALGDLGRAQSLVGESTSGRKNAAIGLSIARTTNDPRVLIHCLENAAGAQGLPGGYSAQSGTEVPYLEEAIEICQQQGDDPLELAGLKLSLAFYCHNDGSKTLAFRRIL